MTNITKELKIVIDKEYGVWLRITENTLVTKDALNNAFQNIKIHLDKLRADLKIYTYSFNNSSVVPLVNGNIPDDAIKSIDPVSNAVIIRCKIAQAYKLSFNRTDGTVRIRFQKRFIDHVDGKRAEFLAEETGKLIESASGSSELCFSVYQDEFISFLKAVRSNALWRVDQEFEFVLGQASPLSSHMHIQIDQGYKHNYVLFHMSLASSCDNKMTYEQVGHWILYRLRQENIKWLPSPLDIQYIYQAYKRGWIIDSYKISRLDPSSFLGPYSVIANDYLIGLVIHDAAYLTSLNPSDFLAQLLRNASRKDKEILQEGVQKLSSYKRQKMEGNTASGQILRPEDIYLDKTPSVLLAIGKPSILQTLSSTGGSGSLKNVTANTPSNPLFNMIEKISSDTKNESTKPRGMAAEHGNRKHFEHKLYELISSTGAFKIQIEDDISAMIIGIDINKIPPSVRVSVELLTAYLEAELTKIGLVQLFNIGKVAGQILAKGEIESMIIAKGQDPQDGEDPSLDEVYLRKEIKEDERGNMNIRQRNYSNIVHSGDLVLQIEWQRRPQKGKDIFGNDLYPAKNLLSEFGDVVLGDGLVQRGYRIYATENGSLVVDYSEDRVLKVSLEKALIIKGAVTLKTGNVDFQGNVEIMGNIEPGAEVKSGGS